MSLQADLQSAIECLAAVEIVERQPCTHLAQCPDPTDCGMVKRFAYKGLNDTYYVASRATLVSLMLATQKDPTAKYEAVAATKMPPWWEPAKRFAWCHPEGAGRMACSNPAEYDPAWHEYKLVTADIDTGKEVTVEDVKLRHAAYALGAVEIAGGRYAWTRPEYDCWVTADAQATIEAAEHHRALSRDSDKHFEDDYCLSADALTCMPAWWSLEKQFAVIHGDKVLTTAVSRNGALAFITDVEFPQQYDDDSLRVVTADALTGNEVPTELEMVSTL